MATTRSSVRRSSFRTIPDGPGEPRQPVRQHRVQEALLLHVKALSDGEDSEVAGQDPAVREMIEAADAAGPEEIAASTGGSS